MPLKLPTVTCTLPVGGVRILATGVGEPVLAFIATKSVEVILALFRAKGVMFSHVKSPARVSGRA